MKVSKSAISISAYILLAASTASVVRAETAVDALLDRAAYLTRTGRAEQARLAYERVLRAVPNHPEALTALGVSAARAGRTGEAQVFLQRLERAHPKAPGRARLAHSVRLGRRYHALLASARKRAQAGQAREAVVLYRQAFGRAGPTPDLELEFLQTLGGTEAGWPEAKAGLTRLVRRRSTRSHRLALARHLSYRASTRRQGIASMQLLLRESEDKATLDALADALVWLDAKEGDAKMYRDFLARRVDPRVESRLQTLMPSSRRRQSRRIVEGFRMLDSAEVAEAKAIFRKESASDEARAGLAAIALREERFGEALEQYQALATSASRRPELWKEGLAAARFWEAMKRAEAALAAKMLDEANAAYEEARAAAYEGHLHRALAGLGFVAVAREDADTARSRFEEALEADDASEPALRGLRDLARRAEDYDEAIAFNQRLLDQEAASARPLGALEGERDRAEASRARKRGELALALRLLNRARGHQPEDPWVLHDLATLHLEAGQTARARAHLDELSVLAPELTEARVLRARVEAEVGHPERALEILQQLPRQNMTSDLARFAARAEVEVEVQGATRRWFSGDHAGARQALLRLQSEHALEPDHLSAVAEGWAQVGAYDRAIGALHDALAAESPPRAGTQLLLASVLLKAHRGTELSELLTLLRNRPLPGLRERRDLLALRVAFAVREADRDRESGRFVRAFDRLAPLLSEHPEEPALLAALGRLFRSSDRLEEAKKVFAQILARTPEDIDARAGAIETSLQLDEREQASLLLDQGLQLLPGHPRMRLVEARFYAQQGKDGEAMEAFARARRLAERLALGESMDGRARAIRIAGLGGEEEAYSEAVAPAVVRAGYAAFGFVNGEGPARSDTQLILQTITEEESQIRQKYALSLEGAFHLRQREGLAGLGLLTEVGGLARANIPVGFDTRVWFEARPVVLDTGARNLDLEQAARFGSLGSVVGATENSVDTSVVGAAVTAGVRFGDLELDVGSTPLGFDIETFTGGLSFQARIGDFGVALQGSRRSVTDSLLSYAGMRDPGTGEVWGGVVRQGGRLDLSIDTDGGLFYLYGAGYHLEGTRVLENFQWMGGLGGEWLLHRVEATEVTLGLGGLAMGYQEDLSQFSLGHGGYFSPQLFLRAGLPLRWRSKEGAWRWRVFADPGLNWFRTDEQAWFPTNDALQAARVAVAGTAEPATYLGRTVLSFSFNAGGALEYMFASGFVAAAQLDVHFAEDYQEVTGGLALRYAFNGQRQRAVAKGSLPSAVARSDLR